MWNSRLPLLLAILSLSAFNLAAQSLPPLQKGVTREWIGPAYWTNPLMNWRLSDGRIECTHGGWVNEMHVLTHQLAESSGSVEMRVKVGLLDGQSASRGEVAFVGFKIGAVGHRNDYRSNVLHDLEDAFAKELMQEPPIRAGITSDGRLLVGSEFSEPLLAAEHLEEAELALTVSHAGDQAQALLTVYHDGEEVASLESTIQRPSLRGNIALACHGLNPPRNKQRGSADVDHPTFWFSEWDASGSKLRANPEQTIGPILWSQYAAHDNTLKLMAFFVPLEDMAERKAELQIQTDEGWTTIAESAIDPLSRTALFRIEDWDTRKDQNYRIAFEWIGAEGKSMAHWQGTVRKDPKDKETIVLAGLSCSNSELFPNRFLVENLLAQDPDLVFFSGDQIYESNGGYPIVVAETEADVPRAALNYLGKFWLSMLGFRDLLKDRPSVMVPDDHDLYSNDLWGKGGMPMTAERCFGGYRMHPDWVNLVEYTQMGYRPDPYDPTPAEQGIRVYTTSLDVGGVSFALVNDRKFKSAPGDVIDAMEPLFAMRGERDLSNLDTINEEAFDTRTLDREDLQLLGERQLAFLRDWAKSDAELRAVLSQSAYCQPHHLMVADMDSNGWPQSGRRRALEAIRDAKAVIITGDLHFATLVQQGIDEWEDAAWSFTLPAVSTQTHRAWRPKTPGKNRLPGMPEYTGRFLDGWKNRITVWAAANPRSFAVDDPYEGEGKRTLDYLQRSALGYGIVRFNTSAATVTFESWPVYGTFDSLRSRQQHPGFPKTIEFKR